MIGLARTLAMVSVMLAGVAACQQTAPAPPKPAPTESDIERQEQSQRVLGVVPMFGVTNRQNAPPLTARQKFHLFFRGAIDPVTFASSAFQAGIGQATGEFPQYGQGAEGYGKRFGATLADSESSGFFTNFFYPALLKEDPRYFRLGTGSTKSRIGYAIKQVFVCHTDRGGRSFNFSKVLGAFTTGAVSNAYYPSNDRGVGLTMSRAGISLVYGTAGDLFSEFWPDIYKKVFKRKVVSRPPQPERR